MAPYGASPQCSAMHMKNFSVKAAMAAPHRDVLCRAAPDPVRKQTLSRRESRFYKGGCPIHLKEAPRSSAEGAEGVRTGEEALPAP